MGNHDLELICPELVQGLEPWIAEVTAWCAEQLTESDLDCIRTFQPRIEIPLDERATLLCYHGSPNSVEERILSTTPPRELDRMLGEYRAAVMAGGHNHVQMVRHHQGNLIVDVGSVGQPFAEMPFQVVPRIMPCAQYAIIGRVGGVLSVDLRRVSIDVDAAKRAALDNEMPGAEAWLSWWMPTCGDA
jgi:hypothetical protein